jgi:hypothetical protein
MDVEKIRDAVLFVVIGFTFIVVSFGLYIAHKTHTEEERWFNTWSDSLLRDHFKECHIIRKKLHCWNFYDQQLF